MAWLKQPGQAFLRGEPLVEIETDKATIVYEAETDGLLAEILVPEGGTAPLGDPIARLGGIEDDNSAQASEQTPQPRALADSPPGPSAQRDPAPRARATPVARRTAAQLGVVLDTLTGTGPDGRIQKSDVLRAGSSGPTADAQDLKGPTTVVALSTTCGHLWLSGRLSHPVRGRATRTVGATRVARTTAGVSVWSLRSGARFA